MKEKGIYIVQYINEVADSAIHFKIPFIPIQLFSL